MADPENCDREWAACVALAKERMAASVSSLTSSTFTLHQLSPATVRAPSGAASSEPASASPTPISASAVSTKNNLTPGARRIYDYLVGYSDYLEGDCAAPVLDTSYAFSELQALHGAVGITNSDLATIMPTNCSSEFPSHDTSESLSVHTRIATPTSPTTTEKVVHEPAVYVVCDDALPIDATCVTALPPANCSTGC
jgi:hypothetical protein